DALTQDPDAKNPETAYLTTTLFRNPPVNRPENTMVGVMSDSGKDVTTGSMTVSDASNWVWEGTGVANGTVLPGILGYEVDRLFPGSPAGIADLAHSPYLLNGTTYYSDMTAYSTAAGTTVLATGSMQWTWGLDDYVFPFSPPGGRGGP